MGIHYFFLYSLIGLLCFQLSSQDKTALTKLYETKTLDEIRIHVRILEGKATETINNEDIHVSEEDRNKWNGNNHFSATVENDKLVMTSSD